MLPHICHNTPESNPLSCAPHTSPRPSSSLSEKSREYTPGHPSRSHTDVHKPHPAHTSTVHSFRI